MTFEEERWNAIRNASLRNERENAAVRDQYVPEVFTADQERELMERIHGTDEERLEKLIAAENERIRKS